MKFRKLIDSNSNNYLFFALQRNQYGQKYGTKSGDVEPRGNYIVSSTRI